MIPERPNFASPQEYWVEKAIPQDQLQPGSSSTAVRWLLVCLLASPFLTVGCQRRAYNDLYIENMAAEIRDLEDQLYAYDHEYRLLEQELDSLRAQNAALQGGSKREPIFPREAPPNSDFLNNNSSGFGDDTPDPSESPSIIEFPSESSDGLPPALPSTSPSGTDTTFPTDFTVPPTIEPGTPMPPPMAHSNRSNDQAGPDNALELNLSRVEIPAQLASQKTALVNEPAGEPPEQPGLSLAPEEEVNDTRVVELAFHPTLSRAANFDEQTDDDGLYLVLQPKNETGQVVPIAADLSVVVLDPARTGDDAKIVRRDLSATQVRENMESAGRNQGIHLTVAWGNRDPIADRVIVFARYTFPDGRQVIGEKTLFTSSEGGLKTVWAPRSRSQNRTQGTSPASSGVRTASASSTQHRDTDAQSSVRTASANSDVSGSHVVRPSVGSSNSSNAPAPSFQPRQPPN